MNTKKHLILCFEMDDKNYNVATIKTFELTTCTRNHVLHRLIWLKSALKICKPNQKKINGKTAS